MWSERVGCHFGLCIACYTVELDSYRPLCKTSEILRTHILYYNFQFVSEVHCDLRDGSQCGSNAECTYDGGYDHSICKCDEGFVGDGFECEPFEESLKDSECTRHSQCLLDEKCVMVYKSSNFAFECVRRDPSDLNGGLTKDTITTTKAPIPGLFMKGSLKDRFYLLFTTYDKVNLSLNHICFYRSLPVIK